MTQVIDFSQYEVDLGALASDRLMPQFRGNGKEVMCGILSEQVRQAQELATACVNTLKGRSLAEAVGVQLDIIGQIVGQGRVIPSLNGGLPFGDEQYRILIIAKIFKNHCLHGSIPEVLQFAKLAFGIDISIYKLGESDVKIGVPSDTDSDVIITMALRVDDLRAENQYFLPFGATTRLLGVMHLPTTPSYFRPDNYEGRTDYAHLAVSTLP